MKQFMKSLENNEEALNSLNVAINFNKDEFLFALHNLVIVRCGFDSLAKKTGLGKESLYKSLTPSTNPRLETILKIIEALGFEIQFTKKENNSNKSPFIRPSSLAHICPELAIEWSSLKNALTPNDVRPTSKQRVWWQCKKKLNHSWQESCNSRLKNNKGCPFCNEY
jgi:probable addiction module antidote protein